MVMVEQLGIPTVLAATTEFIGLAKSSSQSFGMPDQAIISVPHPMGMIPLNEIRAKADAAYAAVVKAAVEWKPAATKLAAAKPVYPAEVIDFEGTEADVNALFIKNKWSLGAPIIPPTPERVAAMLKGTSHKPEEQVGLVPPRLGALTVELVATHAVMAGCKPEVMPVLLAMSEMIAAEDYRSATTTTNPTSPLFIVNGPIRDKLGIAYGMGAAGPEMPVNICLGLAINSIGDIVGGSMPPEGDKATLAWPGNTISVVIGENEDANPWTLLSEDAGFKKGEDVVTGFVGAEIPSNINDHNSVKPEDLMRVMASEMRRGGQNSRFMNPVEVLIIISPEHAQTLFQGGIKDKAAIRKFLWENARNPLKTLPGGGADQAYSPAVVSQRLGIKADLDTLVPIVDKAERIQIMVGGGPGKHSMYVSSFNTPAEFKHLPVSKWK